jgi:dTDP-4-dehydrorhamnose 3,5-epimerase
MPFSFERTTISDVIVVTPRVFRDERGFFLETYKRSEFRVAGITEDFVQDNRSYSTMGVIRGLHYQTDPAAQGKLVCVIAGTIFDVAVDIRKDSPAFGKWIGIELSAKNRKMLYIPTGFAHGFAVMSETAEVTYKVTSEYSAEHEAGILWNDPEIGIKWPVNNPLVSAKDKENSPFAKV